MQILFDIGQALIQEGVVAAVGVGKIGDGGEVGEDREIQGVANFHCNVERGIVERSFRSLHPVDNAFRIWRRGPPRRTRTLGLSAILRSASGKSRFVAWEVIEEIELSLRTAGPSHSAPLRRDDEIGLGYQHNGAYNQFVDPHRMPAAHVERKPAVEYPTFVCEDSIGYQRPQLRLM